MSIVHLPDTEDTGTACGLVFGGLGWISDLDSVITDPEEVDDVTCTECLTTL